MDNSEFLVYDELQSSLIFEVPFGKSVLSSEDLKSAKEAEEIIIPQSITSIDFSAFKGFSKLKRINIPGSVKSIGIDSFADCTSLEHVVLTEGLEVIYQRAFWGCISLKTIDLPASLNEIFEGAFGECHCEINSKTTNYSYDNGALFNHDKSILLYCNSAIEHYTIPSSVTIINWGAFWGCAIKDICIPNTVERIGLCAFRDCKKLEKVEILGEIDMIGNYVFYGCSNLHDVILPKTIKSIGVAAFQKCSSLDEIIVPNSIESIPEDAFGHNTTIIKTDGTIIYSADEEDEDDYPENNDNFSDYGRYAGTYAQDVVGWTDEMIDDALDGDPDAYWNID